MARALLSPRPVDECVRASGSRVLLDFAGTFVAFFRLPAVVLRAGCGSLRGCDLCWPGVPQSASGSDRCFAGLVAFAILEWVTPATANVRVDLIFIGPIVIALAVIGAFCLLAKLVAWSGLRKAERAEYECPLSTIIRSLDTE